MPKVLLLRAELLPVSETFVVGQAAALGRYEAGFAGLKRVPGGLDVPGVVAVLDGDGGLSGKAARAFYAKAGCARGFDENWRSGSRMWRMCILRRMRACFCRCYGGWVCHL